MYSIEDDVAITTELRLASSDGCRTELIAVFGPGSGGPAFHMTADGSEGVFLWSENIEEQYIVRRLDFTVDNSGVLTLGSPVTVLPLAGQEALPGDYLYFRQLNIRGDATHDSLYVILRERRVFNSGSNAGEGTRVLLIYDLNALTDVTASPDRREIYNEDAGGWQDTVGLDCSSVTFPHFVPTCHRPDGLQVNPSGTRLYIPANVDAPDGERWTAALRIHLDMGGGQALDQWIISAPELVFTGPLAGPGPANVYDIALRPHNDPSQLPSPEFIAAGFPENLGNSTTTVLNTDQCVADYAPYASGTSEAPIDLWQGCINTDLVSWIFPPSSTGFWQTPDALLQQDAKFFDQFWNQNIYRRYVTGALAGTEELVIDNDLGD